MFSSVKFLKLLMIRNMLVMLLIFLMCMLLMLIIVLVLFRIWLIFMGLMMVWGWWLWLMFLVWFILELVRGVMRSIWLSSILMMCLFWCWIGICWLSSWSMGRGFWLLVRCIGFIRIEFWVWGWGFLRVVVKGWLEIGGVRVRFLF